MALASLRMEAVALAPSVSRLRAMPPLARRPRILTGLNLFSTCAQRQPTRPHHGHDEQQASVIIYSTDEQRNAKHADQSSLRHRPTSRHLMMLSSSMSLRLRLASSAFVLKS